MQIFITSNILLFVSLLELLSIAFVEKQFSMKEKKKHSISVSDISIWRETRETICIPR